MSSGYRKFEDAFLTWINEFDWRSIDVQNESIKAMEVAVAKLKLERDKTRRILKRNRTWLEEREDAPPTLVDEIESGKAKLTNLETRLSNAERELGAELSASLALIDSEELRASVQDRKDGESRLRLRQAIRLKISRIDLNFKTEIAELQCTTEFQNFRYPECAVKVTFANGERSVIIFFRSAIDGKLLYLVG